MAQSTPRFFGRLAGVHTLRRRGWAVLAFAALAIVVVPPPASNAAPTDRHAHVGASNFAYAPALIAVNPGDRVTVELAAADVMHGLYVDGYDLNVVAEPGQTARLTFVAERPGAFRFRCSATCGALHPFMIGLLSVGPNWLLWRALGLAVLAAAGGLWLVQPRRDKATPILPRMRLSKNHARYDLTRLPGVKSLLRSRWPQFGLTALALGGLVFAIVTGLAGTPVGSRNFDTVFVWIAWWALLMLIAVPLFGRGWCSICPVPAPGEWLQRGALLRPAAGGRALSSGLGLGLRWPRALRSMWLQNGAFALVALFSVVVLTQPRITALVLAALLLVALRASVVFERRAFCRYLCPVGGFIGLYAQLAPLEVRVKDAAVCAAHTTKTCYTGSADGYGCPWQVFPGSLVKNTYCGMCLECLRTCPHDNVALNLRPFGADLQAPAGRRLDEAFKVFVMLGSVLVYSAVMLGRWGVLKSAAHGVGSAAWWAYALAFLALVFGVLPGLFWLVVALGRALARSPVPTRRAFVALAYSLVPLGLAAWIAFSLSFVFANLSYLWPALSDPLGWGWNLLGTARLAWTPYLTGIVPGLQVIVVLGGVWWASAAARQIAGEQLAPRAAVLQAMPIAVFCLLASMVLLGLLIA